MKLSGMVALGLICSLGACAGGGGGGGGGGSSSVASLKTVEVEAQEAEASAEAMLPEADPAPVSDIEEIPIAEVEATTGDFDETITVVDTAETSLVDNIISGAQAVSYDNGLTRYSATIDGASYVLDVFDDNTVALLQSDVNGGMPTYSIGDDLVPVQLPEGNYFGKFDVTFTNDGVTYQSETGEMAAAIDLERGLVLLGGTVFHDDGQLSIYADAAYSEGVFTATDQSLQIRDANGAYVRDELADIDGITTDTHILGTMSSVNADTGFAAKGHFSAK